MIRRIAALIGIGVVIAVLVLLVWAVHLHRQRTLLPESDAAILSAEP